MRIIKRSIIGSLMAIGLMFAGATSASATYEVGLVGYSYETPGMVTQVVWDGSNWNPVRCWPIGTQPN